MDKRTFKNLIGMQRFRMDHNLPNDLYVGTYNETVNNQEYRIFKTHNKDWVPTDPFSAKWIELGREISRENY